MIIRPVEKDQAPDTVKRIYEALEHSLGGVPNSFKVLAHKPDVLRTFNQLYSAVWTEGIRAGVDARRSSLPRSRPCSASPIC